VNKSFALNDFKEIFWLEYLHRLLGRIIGMVVVFGTFYFAIRKRFTRPLFHRMLWISALVGAQGGVGWVMVASGLVEVEATMGELVSGFTPVRSSTDSIMKGSLGGMFAARSPINSGQRPLLSSAAPSMYSMA
jgi:cytochrome c oxidase assembly protein subunit 15